MPKLTSRILVINDEPLVLREFVKGLNAAARTLDNPLGISFTGVTTGKEALSLIESDRDLQSVLVDDRLYILARNGSNSKKKLQMSALELVQRITRFRPELDVYILIAQEKEDDVVDKLFTESVDGYFYREERDYRGIYRILNAQIQERARTPFYDQLKNYVWMAKDQWHTPGHSSGESLRGSPWVNDFYEFMGEHVFDADLSVSVPMLDSLMEPKGVIAEAQAMAAKAFGARRTYFATNGTSTANKVIFQTLLAPGEKLLLDRNCHKSVHHGVVLAGVDDPHQRSGVQGTPVPRELQHAYLDQPAIRAHRQPRRRAQAGDDGRLQAALAHARAGQRGQESHNFDTRVPRPRARRSAARRGPARRHPARPHQGDDRHLGLRLYRRRPAEAALRALQHPGREIDLQYAHAAADHRHHALQGIATLRCAHAHRAREPRSQTAGADPGDPRVHQAAVSAARRLLLRRRAGSGVRRARARQREARRAHLRRPDRALPARHPGPRAGAARHLPDRRLHRRPAAFPQAHGDARGGARRLPAVHQAP